LLQVQKGSFQERNSALLVVAFHQLRNDEIIITQLDPLYFSTFATTTKPPQLPFEAVNPIILQSFPILHMK